jgi:nitroreductase
MDTLIAIHTRQSVSNLLPDPIPQEVIARLLDAANQAPNHYRVRPWRFVVLTGGALDRMGAVLVQSLLERNPAAPEAALEAERQKPHRAPVIIAVGVDKPAQPKVLEIENVAAASAAVQNLLLAAHDLGLGAKWRTGTDASDPHLKRFLGFEPDQHLIALVYLGYPTGPLPPPERPSFEDRTVWMDS